MADNAPIQLQLDLPQDLLPQLTQLVRAVQTLAVSLRGLSGSAPVEEAVNTGFDLATFQGLAGEDSPGERTPAGTNPLPKSGSSEQTVSSVSSGPTPAQEREQVPVPPPERAPRSVPPEERPIEDVPPVGAEVQRLLPPEKSASPKGNPSGEYLPGESRWRSGAYEELHSAGPAPLTAEAVSLAFRRDDRRYDSGFPLY